MKDYFKYNFEFTVGNAVADFEEFLIVEAGTYTPEEAEQSCNTRVYLQVRKIEGELKSFKFEQSNELAYKRWLKELQAEGSSQVTLSEAIENAQEQGY